jgi:hypothetical protein
VLPVSLSIAWSVAKTKNEGFIFRDIFALHFFVADTTFQKLSALSDQPVNLHYRILRTYTTQELVSGYAADNESYISFPGS